jgi:ATP-binding cassette subfamily C (CFTR/MRP) protein 1
MDLYVIERPWLRKLTSYQACIITYGILQLVLLILWASKNNQNRNIPSIAITANTLGILDAIALCVLSFLEHRHSIRPSTLITLYLLPSVAFDAVQCRTLWLSSQAPRSVLLATIFSISLGFKTGMLVLEVIEKRGILISPWNLSSPESLSGTINRSVFWWLNALFVTGYKGVLELASLWPTDHSMDSKRLLERLTISWTKTKSNTRKHALALAMVKCIKWPIMAVSLPRLCLIGLRFSQPLLLKRIVNFVGQPGGQHKINTGYALIGATALVYLGNAVRNSNHV